MKAIYICSLILFFNLNFTYSQSHNTYLPLTKEQKENDFLYLFNELLESYPYFEINKRTNNVDWKSNKDLYIEKVRKTDNDTQFIKVIIEILGDLNNDHVDISPTYMYDWYYKTFSKVSNNTNGNNPYVEELTKCDARQKSEYWSGIYYSLNNNNISSNDKENNVEFKFDQRKSIAIIKIHSFFDENIEKDKDMLKSFFKKAKHYKNLIVDIQGNTGGNDEYWKSNIVANLVKKQTFYPVLIAYKDSKRIRKQKPYYNANIDLKEINLPKLPQELKNHEFSFFKSWNVIIPHKIRIFDFNSIEKQMADSNRLKNINSFKGQIYLLVDSMDFSSAETFAYFCRVTNFAKIAGTLTAGDGIGSDPLLLTLPNSGILIRFSGEMALNPDGSSNAEARTFPDISLNGRTKQLRLEQLIEYIININSIKH